MGVKKHRAHQAFLLLINSAAVPPIPAFPHKGGRSNPAQFDRLLSN